MVLSVSKSITSQTFGITCISLSKSTCPPVSTLHSGVVELSLLFCYLSEPYTGDSCVVEDFTEGLYQSKGLGVNVRVFKANRHRQFL